MTEFSENLSRALVELPRPALQRMVKLVRLLDRLSRNRRYREQVYAQLPEVARFDPGHDAVMMCYDFHLSGDIPRLIEVNTNAGGGLLAYLAHDPSLPVVAESLTPKLAARLLQTFAQEMLSFTDGQQDKPVAIAIIDEEPQSQYLYPEMRAFAELFRNWGVPAEVVDPAVLQAAADGVFLNGQPIDLIYNRHCDFYLESGALAGIRAAYLQGKVCLTPNPHMYGLLADKRRLALWSDRRNHADWALTDQDSQLLAELLPDASLMMEHDPQELWSSRKQLVFKPVDSFGSRGVLLGEKISRKRFDQLPPRETLVQALVPPSFTAVPDEEPMKTDLRAYAYRGKILGVTARLYRGQVTNLRTPGGGFARVKTV